VDAPVVALVEELEGAIVAAADPRHEAMVGRGGCAVVLDRRRESAV
jgi:hypothetical protein